MKVVIKFNYKNMIRGDVNMDMEMAMEMEKKKGLTASALKYIAVITMVFDHFGAAILEKILNNYGMSQLKDTNDIMTFFSNNKMALNVYIIDTILRLIGRLSFPIFCFLIVEGFLHTRNIRKYIGRMFIIAIISEIPFDLASKGKVLEFTSQNTIFTLLIGLCVLWCMDSLKNKVKNRILQIIAAAFVIAAGSVIAILIKSDYSFYGILVISLMYLLQSHKMIGSCLGSIVLCINNLMEITTFFNMLILGKYNGLRGKSNKWFFYIFYPAHLLILGIAALFI